MSSKETKNYTAGQSSPKDKLRNFARHGLSNLEKRSQLVTFLDYLKP